MERPLCRWLFLFFLLGACMVWHTQIPVFAASYVLSGYGTGAVMGNPEHDERDGRLAAAHGLAPSEHKDAAGPEMAQAVCSRGAAEGVSHDPD